MQKILTILGVLSFAFMACSGGGPEDAVSGMLDALKDRDIDAMMQYIPEVARSMYESLTEEAREDMFSRMYPDLPEDLEFNIIDSEVSEDGNSATITGELSSSSLGQSIEQTFTLVLEDGNWVIILSSGMI